MCVCVCICNRCHSCFKHAIKLRLLVRLHFCESSVFGLHSYSHMTCVFADCSANIFWTRADL